jgi:hypothetical protein
METIFDRFPDLFKYREAKIDKYQSGFEDSQLGSPNQIVEDPKEHPDLNGDDGGVDNGEKI